LISPKGFFGRLAVSDDGPELLLGSRRATTPPSCARHAARDDDAPERLPDRGERRRGPELRQARDDDGLELLLGSRGQRRGPELLLGSRMISSRPAARARIRRGRSRVIYFHGRSISSENAPSRWKI
jgi:hypothetical protein